jgi:hypothetical protein
VSDALGFFKPGFAFLQLARLARSAAEQRRYPVNHFREAFACADFDASHYFLQARS